jgi:hypothetical protein
VSMQGRATQINGGASGVGTSLVVAESRCPQVSVSVSEAVLTKLRGERIRDLHESAGRNERY